MKYKFEERPTCVCGCKMKWVNFVGYYDEFSYWCCENCNNEDKEREYDKQWFGGYA